MNPETLDWWSRVSPGMSNVLVASDAREAIVFSEAAGVDVVGDVRVATSAGILGYPEAAGLHGNRLMKIAGRKGVGMPETVIGLRPVLANEVVRRVAIVAGGH